jgi:protein-S-isoprenylcysteine O-methyltransferase Ste14
MPDPLALDNPVAAALVFGPLVGSVFVEHRRFPGDARRRRDDLSYWRLQAWQLAGLLLGVFAAKKVPEAAFAGPEWLWVACGSGVGCFGLCLRWWAIRALGRQFTRNLQVMADHQLVTNGPYRILRHPSYTGAVLMFVGVGVGLVNALSFAACLVLPTVGYIQRIPREEAMLRLELGKPYVEYSSRTKRLVPGVW